MSRYDDILLLPRHVSVRRAPMSMIDRAAQFSPFAALTGYDGVIAETARLTEQCMELDGESIQQLDLQLQKLQELLPLRPIVTVTWFQPDERKDGGSYRTKTGPVKGMDTVERYLLFADRTRIPFPLLIALQIPNQQEKQDFFALFP